MNPVRTNTVERKHENIYSILQFRTIVVLKKEVLTG